MRLLILGSPDCEESSALTSLPCFFMERDAIRRTHATVAQTRPAHINRTHLFRDNGVGGASPSVFNSSGEGSMSSWKLSRRISSMA